VENSYLHQDQCELLQCFVDARVKFLVVGGFAFAAHAFVRATKDIDLWVEASADNANAIMAALRAFGAPLEAHGITASDFQTRDIVYQLGLDPVRIDVLTHIPGVTFEEAWQRRIESKLSGIAVPVISLDDLIANKKAVGRDQDKTDVTALEQVRKSQKDKP